ncbi:sulfite exporter TauE/SafE family protein [Leptolyngbya sp. AN02str]|uniref:urease accessory protein UreH domain-containing protein n=1 Tax=Leptolyngbya sp. AN02str TaxID=3423363 RepID=UPI003D322805
MTGRENLMGIRGVQCLALTTMLWGLWQQMAIAHPGHANPDLVHLLQAEQPLTPGLMVGGLGVAIAFGAGHALAPGHGKTLAAAYLLGERQTPWHAIALGLTTTITHTVGVFGLGAIALLAAHWGWGDRIYPVLSTASGILVLGLGVWLLAQRLNGLDSNHGDAHALHPHGHHHEHPQKHPHDHPQKTMQEHSHEHPHEHPHDHHGYHPPAHAHGHTHTHLLFHAHTHDHHHDHHHDRGHDLAGSGPIQRSGVLALGIAGGLVPCPSALVLLLTAIALHRTAYGMALVTAFSLGLTLVLVGLGLSIVYSRQWLDKLPQAHPAVRYLPIASAVFMMAVGAILTARAVV